MSLPPQCPGCGGTTLSGEFLLRNQPVVMNYLCHTKEAALRIKRSDILLTQCTTCGLIYNSTLENEPSHYDERYENRQEFSPRFQEHLRERVSDLTRRHRLESTHVVEIGCGTGGFLRLLCTAARATGEGYDLSYRCDPLESEPLPGVVFHARYASPSDIDTACSAIICRHVIEHVRDVRTFLAELHQMAVAAGDPVVVIETPRWEWIEEQCAFWDIFYEHCNYFTESTLAWLASEAGFEVIHHIGVFGGQYQWLELRRRPEAGRSASKSPAPSDPCGLESLAHSYEASVAVIRQQIDELAADEAWALWGAGAKGVSLAQHLQAKRPAFAVDVNPHKRGCFLPGTAVEVISPDDERLLSLALIVVVNPIYEHEIKLLLGSLGYAGRVMGLHPTEPADSVVIGPSSQDEPVVA